MHRTTLHVLTEAEPFSEFNGGAISRWVANVLRNMAHSVVVCPSADDTWKFAPETICVLRRLRFYKRFRRFIAHLPWFVHRRVIQEIFRPMLARVGPGDIVWIHNRPEFALALAAHIHRAGARIALQLHNSHLVDGPAWLMRQVRVDRLIFSSEFLLDQARKKFPSLGASSVLYGGADETIFYPPVGGRRNAEIVTVLFAGRLVAEKGAHILLDAMTLLGKQGVPLQAQIVGSSSFGEGEETQYIRDLKAASPTTVQFLPYRSGAALGDLFREADMFCSPSVWKEPFGLVNVEALASALPIVSTHGGGATEVLAQGGGIMVERGSAAQLASALRRLTECPELRSELGGQGYAAFCERFTWSRTRTRAQEIQRMILA
jgi:spore coat protein SA